MLNRLRVKFDSLEQSILDARAAVELTQLGLPHLPWPGSALSPSALLGLLNDVQINNRKRIVEFGAGISTVYLAKILDETDGHLISIESDAAWAAVVNGWLDRCSLRGNVEIVVAPLGPCDYAVEGTSWYDFRIVDEAISGGSIDCVLVDGPPAYAPGQDLARYPAIHAVEKYLAEDSVIFLDDIRRKGEQEVLVRWEARTGIKFERYHGRGGVARGIKGRAYYSAI